VLVLALMVRLPDRDSRALPLLVSTSAPETSGSLEEMEPLSIDTPNPANDASTPIVDPSNLLPTNELAQIDVSSELEKTLKVDLPGDEQSAVGSPARGLTTGTPGGFDLRLDSDLKGRGLREGGGTEESEAAVALALKWLAEHQYADGSWSFDHAHSPKCRRRCANVGFERQAKRAATALALLPFLGSGQTQLDGKYRKNVEAGLYYLTRSMQVRDKMGSFWDPHGRMYGHGLASIAVCEAYGMTRDHALREPAQAALNFIVYAQDPVGGGWRYEIHQPGDTSVVGWQLMALTSGRMAYLQVPQQTMRNAGYFLDAVQSNEGAAYGYVVPGTRPATTAIGLLCRMYLGWPRDNPALVQGIEALSTWGPSTNQSGPSRNNMYYNYYATQVMHHFGGSDWRRWNDTMRDYLIATQSRKGHERGSWYLEGADDGAGPGGRLYFTAMAAMTLEVYYRHLPLYKPDSMQHGFVNE
jgi:hypothetical protein